MSFERLRPFKIQDRMGIDREIVLNTCRTNVEVPKLCFCTNG